VSELSSFHTAVEAFLTDCSSKEGDLTKAQLEDCLNSIEQVFDAIINIAMMLNELHENKIFKIVRFSDGYLNLAQKVYKTYRPSEVNGLIERFNSCNLSISGFKAKGKMKINTRPISKNIFVPLVCGGLMLVLAVYFGFYKLIDTGVQYFIFRALFAAGLGTILGTLMAGKINLTVKYNQIALTAAGSIAIFVLLLLVNPAPPPEYTSDHKTITTQAK